MTGADFKGFVLSDATIVGLIGTRLFPMMAPQEVVQPFATYQFIDRTPQHALRGAAAFMSLRVQVDWYASSYATAEAVKTAATALLDGHLGSVGTTPDVGARFESERQGYDELTKLWRWSQDFILSF